MNIKQPVTGLLATATVIAASWCIIACFSTSTFMGWFGFYLICCVTVQTVLAFAWLGQHPHCLGKLAQPAKGIAFTLLNAALGAVVAAILFYTVDGRVSPPSPMAVHYGILCIILSYAWIFMWQGWPFTSIFKRPMVSGIALFISYFIAGYVFFRYFFNFAFLKGSSVYSSANDPGGLFMAWQPLTVGMGVIVGMFLPMCFDMWPIYKFPRLMKQPVLGIVWSAISAIVAALIYHVGIDMMRIDVVMVMARYTVPFTFGFIVVLFIVQGWPFTKFAQPLKGVLTTTLSLLLGYALSLVYLAIAPLLSGRLLSGPPTYGLEIWLATALLGLSCPLLAVSAIYFEFWPFSTPERLAPSGVDQVEERNMQDRRHKEDLADSFR